MSKEDIAYLSDMLPSGAAGGNVPAFSQDGKKLTDSGKSANDLALKSDVARAASEIWDAVKNEYAIAAYNAPAWDMGITYNVGDYCKHDSNGATYGYRCKEAHVSTAQFNEEYWDVVLTPSGIAVITAMLSECVPSGMAPLSDLAPTFDENAGYEVNQLAVKDGVLQVCTATGTGSDATFSQDATIEASIANRISALKALIGDFVAGSVIDDPFDGTKEYSVGDTCSHGGGFYECKEHIDASSGNPWDPSKWKAITVKSKIAASGGGGGGADWDAGEGQPGYIAHKPDIPKIDATLGIEGEAADAKEVGDRLREIASSTTAVGYAFAVPERLQSGHYQLVDRAINTISESAYASNIVLDSPDATENPAGGHFARDFVVVVDFSQPGDVDSSITVYGWSMCDYSGASIDSLVVQDNNVHAFRFTESSVGRTFIVAGISDYRTSEIEEAVNDVYDELGLDSQEQGE